MTIGRFLIYFDWSMMLGVTLRYYCSYSFQLLLIRSNRTGFTIATAPGLSMLRKMLQRKRLVYRLGRPTVSWRQVTGPVEESTRRMSPRGGNE